MMLSGLRAQREIARIRGSNLRISIDTMKKTIVAAVIVAGLALSVAAAAKEKKEAGPVKPIGWLYVHDAARELSVSKEDFQKGKRPLPLGSLVPVFKSKVKDGVTYGRVASLNLETGQAELGWVKIDLAELKPPDAYPPDDDLVPHLGGPYLDDVVAKHTDMARFLLHQPEGPDVLLCYVFTGSLSMAKLVAFTSNQGKYTPGASMNIPMMELEGGLSSIEIRDLVGDGNECIIGKEYFRELASTLGSNLVIRRIVDGKFETVWKAPVRYKNLSQYNAEMKILKPPETNIGAPGTVTTGEVTYRPSGKGATPVWKGKVEFFVINHEKALDTVAIEKACPWDGNEFAPLK